MTKKKTDALLLALDKAIVAFDEKNGLNSTGRLDFNRYHNHDHIAALVNALGHHLRLTSPDGVVLKAPCDGSSYLLWEAVDNWLTKWRRRCEEKESEEQWGQTSLF